MNYIKLFLNIYLIVMTITYSIALYYLFTKAPRNELKFSITSKDGMAMAILKKLNKIDKHKENTNE